MELEELMDILIEKNNSEYTFEELKAKLAKHEALGTPEKLQAALEKAKEYDKILAADVPGFDWKLTDQEKLEYEKMNQACKKRLEELFKNI